MKTPNTRAGRITEDIMAEVRRKNPTIQTSVYNGIYSAVLERLTEEFADSDTISKLITGIPL